jgi:hypothetical protein
VVRRVHVGARLDQQLRHLGVVGADGPVKRRRSVALCRVDVGALADEGAHRFAVAGPDRVDEADAGTGCAQADR